MAAEGIRHHLHVQNHPQNLMQGQPRLTIKNHVIMKFPNAPTSASTN
jgi:hypothetical protein